MNRLVLKDFKAVVGRFTEITEKEKARRIKLSLEKGLVFSNVSISNFDEVLEDANDLFGNEVERLNATFYQNMTQSNNLTEEEKNILQAIHYLSTYGGIEVLKNDGDGFTMNQNKDLKEKITSLFTFIQVVEEKELKELLLKELTKNVALTEKTVNELVRITEYYNISLEKECELIKNRQFKNYLTEKYNLVPKNVDEFFRLIFKTVLDLDNVYKTESYLNKFNNHLRFKEEKEKVKDLINRYIELYGYVELGKASNRYRKIWLIIKKHTKLTVINKILRIAKKGAVPKYIPFIERALNTDLIEFEKGIKTLNNFALVKLYNTCLYRMNTLSSYSRIKIRNGKIKDLRDRYYKDSKPYLKLLKKQLVENLKEKFENKVVILPKEVELAVPVNENRFLGKFIPFGSRVKVKENTVFGINWNYNSDLDLHSYSQHGYHIGFSGNKDGFSGDMTRLNDKGYASEFIDVEKARVGEDFGYFVSHLYFKNCNENTYLQLTVGKANQLEGGMMINKKDVMINIPFEVEEEFDKEVTLAFADKDYIIFGGNFINKHTRKYEVTTFEYEQVKHTLKLKELLKLVGAKVTTKEVETPDYDLRLSTLTRDKLLSILG